MIRFLRIVLNIALTAYALLFSFVFCGLSLFVILALVRDGQSGDTASILFSIFLFAAGILLGAWQIYGFWYKPGWMRWGFGLRYVGEGSEVLWKAVSVAFLLLLFAAFAYFWTQPQSVSCCEQQPSGAMLR